MEEFGDEETALFNELWAKAAFDIISAVLDKCADWDKYDQDAMVYMIVEQLARRYGVIKDDEDADKD